MGELTDDDDSVPHPEKRPKNKRQINEFFQEEYHPTQTPTKQLQDESRGGGEENLRDGNLGRVIVRKLRSVWLLRRWRPWQTTTMLLTV